MTHTLLRIMQEITAQTAHASVYTGGGIGAGVAQAGSVSGSNLTVREIIINIVNAVLGFVGLIAVITIIIAGLYLIFSGGNESSRDTAKKIILYTAIGLLIILIASAFVIFIKNASS